LIGGNNEQNITHSKGFKGWRKKKWRLSD